MAILVRSIRRYRIGTNARNIWLRDVIRTNGTMYRIKRHNIETQGSASGAIRCSPLSCYVSLKYKAREMTATKLAEVCGVSRSVLYRWIRAEQG